MKEVDNVHTSCHDLVVEREGRQLVVLPDQDARKHSECEWGHTFHLGSNAKSGSLIAFSPMPRTGGQPSMALYLIQLK